MADQAAHVAAERDQAREQLMAVEARMAELQTALDDKVSKRGRRCGPEL